MYNVFMVIVGTAYGGPSAISICQCQTEEAAQETCNAFKTRVNQLPNAVGDAWYLRTK